MYSKMSNKSMWNGQNSKTTNIRTHVALLVRKIDARSLCCVIPSLDGFRISERYSWIIPHYELSRVRYINNDRQKSNYFHELMMIEDQILNRLLHPKFKKPKGGLKYKCYPDLFLANFKACKQCQTFFILFVTSKGVF